MNNGRKPDRAFGRLFRGIRSALGGTTGDQAPAAENVDTPVASAAASTPSAGELINQGLQQRQQHGAAAALPFFERAAQLEPNSHLPHFMLGNAASELEDLDAAVRHYARARDLQPNDHVIRYNLGLNHLWRGYIDAAIEELRTACALNPAYLSAQSS